MTVLQGGGIVPPLTWAGVAAGRYWGGGAAGRPPGAPCCTGLLL